MSDHSYALPGPENVTLMMLDNGLRLLVRENHSAPVVVLEGYLSTGAVHDPTGKAGLGSFVAETVTRGSEQYDYARFNELVEAVGAGLVVSGDIHTTSLSISSLDEDLPLLIDLLADALRRPTFAPEQIDLVRTQTLIFHQEREQDTRRRAGMRFYTGVYGDHPYGRPVSGYPETVSGFTREDLLSFHNRHYTPRAAILVVSGAVDTAAVQALVQRGFGDWQGEEPDRTLAPPTPATTGSRSEIAMPDKFQSDIVLGFPAVSRLHPDYDALRVANTILGRFGMMGRLGEKVREEMGLAYYCYSSQDAELLSGVWQMTAGVNPANVERALDAILAQCQRLATEPVPAAELADSQAYLTGIVPLTLETNEGTAGTLLNMLWYDLGLDYLQTYSARINHITTEDVLRVASTYLRPERCVVAVAGPEAG